MNPVRPFLRWRCQTCRKWDTPNELLLNEDIRLPKLPYEGFRYCRQAGALSSLGQRRPGKTLAADKRQVGAIAHLSNAIQDFRRFRWRACSLLHSLVPCKGSRNMAFPAHTRVDAMDDLNYADFERIEVRKVRNQRKRSSKSQKQRHASL